ncbi:exonuclease domain-containing protein [Nonomuraea sp. NPDC049646]|uniref:3'-5' exonuclease n=1 Tax=unclassified Nonomuraea TaxID=2593643 RepID=UPI00378E44E4
MTTSKGRTTAHNASQLQKAMDITAEQLARAQAAGLIPDHDMKTPRWSGPLVDQLVARRQEILDALPDDLSQDQLMQALGMTYGQWRRAEEAGLLPAPDRGEFWTRPVADELIARADELREQTPPQPLGAARCAQLLSEAVGVEVDLDDFRTLVKAGHTEAVSSYKKWNLYDVGRLHQLVSTGEGRRLVIDVVAERQAWLAGSMPARDAAHYLGWSEEDFVRVAAQRDIRPGRFDRYARTDVAALADDEDLVERVRRERLLGPEQAAQHMEIRRRDFDYVVAAGWVAPSTFVERELGDRSRPFKTIRVPLYQVGDLEDALATPGVDWEEVRAVKPGAPSPLREHTRLPIARADAVRAFCGDLSSTWSVEVWPRWANRDDVWHIDWEQRPDGHPTKAEVHTALHAHRAARRHAGQVVLSTAVGDVINWARRMLQPGAAVVLDTETTGLDGLVIEIGCVDAYDGSVLLHTLVNPAGVPVEPGARAVHGICDEDLAGAPRWEEVWPLLAAAVEGRQILAYNAPFDRGRIAATHAHAGLDRAHLPGQDRWACLMQARSTWARIGYRLPLGGAHRALGDAQDGHAVLHAMATPAR